MTDIVEVASPSSVISATPPSSVVEVSPSSSVVSVDGQTSVLTAGIQGPAGPPGDAIIGGYTVTVSSLGNGDVLSFDGVNSYWKNTKSTELTDGGNF